MTNNTPDAYHSLLQHLAELSDRQEIQSLLAALLTDKELQDIANRVRIFDLLEQGVTQRVIAQQLGVGIATVSRGAIALKRYEQEAIKELLKVHRRELK
ncbi:Trp family transcriptional regulator [Psychrobacter sp.]|uniref:Trp family transcriptional regulator n=1 Tax=Psychrobacter sp. TaxID=56811 RepID=UPI0025ED449B|nr:Trp family transcriptional regulator [Psychrobacter sp.]